MEWEPFLARLGDRWLGHQSGKHSQYPFFLNFVIFNCKLTQGETLTPACCCSVGSLRVPILHLSALQNIIKESKNNQGNLEVELSREGLCKPLWGCGHNGAVGHGSILMSPQCPSCGRQGCEMKGLGLADQGLMSS